MWWEKKPRVAASDRVKVLPPPPVTLILDKPMTNIVTKLSPSTFPEQEQMFLGRTLVLKGDLSGNEDLLIEGKFEGSIDLQDHCLTVGPEGQVKAEIHAARVVVQGSV